MLEDLSHAVGARIKNNCVNVKKKETTCSIKTGWKPSFLKVLGLEGHRGNSPTLSSVHRKSL